MINFRETIQTPWDLHVKTLNNHFELKDYLGFCFSCSLAEMQSCRQCPTIMIDKLPLRFLNRMLKTINYKWTQLSKKA